MRSLLPQVIRHAEGRLEKTVVRLRARNRVDPEEIEKLRRRAPRQAELLEAIAQLSGPIRGGRAAPPDVAR